MKNCNIAYDIVRQHTMSYVSIRCRTSTYDVVYDMAMHWTLSNEQGSMGAAGVAGISPSRTCRLFWHGSSRLPKHVVLSFWTSLRVSNRTKSPGQTAHVISAQRAPSKLPSARACVRSACALRMRTRMHARACTPRTPRASQNDEDNQKNRSMHHGAIRIIRKTVP